MTELTLASASPRRRVLLGALERPFKVVTAAIDETQWPGEAPIAYARRLAEAKARAVAAGGTRGVIIGADTIVVLDGVVLGKPPTPEVARDHLRRLRGRSHLVVTAVAALDTDQDRLVEGVEGTAVWLRSFTDEEIERYVAGGEVMDKPGAYAIQHDHFAPVACLQGSETNVIGLPLALVADLLARLAAAT